MIDVNQKALFQPFKACALNAVAFQDDGGFVLPVYPIALNNSVRERQRPIHTWHAVAQHNIRLFAHRVQNLAAGQSRTNRIAIRTRMRRQKKALALLDVFENFSQHTTSNFQLLYLSGTLQQFVNSRPVLL